MVPARLATITRKLKSLVAFEKQHAIAMRRKGANGADSPDGGSHGGVRGGRVQGESGISWCRHGWTDAVEGRGQTQK